MLMDYMSKAFRGFMAPDTDDTDRGAGPLQDWMLSLFYSYWPVFASYHPVGSRVRVRMTEGYYFLVYRVSAGAVSLAVRADDDAYAHWGGVCEV